MTCKSPKPKVLGTRIADAQYIIDAQQALLEKLRITGEPTHEAEGALRTYVSALMHLRAHEKKLKLEAKAKRGETKKKWMSGRRLLDQGRHQHRRAAAYLR